MSNNNTIESTASKIVSIIILVLAIIVFFNLLSSNAGSHIQQQSKKTPLIEGDEDNRITAETAFLSIYSIPSDAEVWLDHKLVGSTPIKIPKLTTSDTHSITLKHPLAKPDTFEVNLTAGQIKKEIRELIYENGNLNLSSSPLGAKIFIDGRYTDKITPDTFELPAGSHTVRLKLDNYASYGNTDHSVFIHPKKTNSLELKLEPLYSISVNVTPFTNIFIRDTDKDYFPHMRLPKGKYTIEANKNGYEPLSEVVLLDGNKNFNFTLFIKKTNLNITSFPKHARVSISGKGSYKPGMKINAGVYTVTAKAKGYWSKSFSLDIKDDLDLHIALDSTLAPKMISVPKGSFYMGGNGEFNRPIHSKNINSFYASSTEVNNQQWSRCVRDGACVKLKKTTPRQAPAVSMSWHETQRYINWLNSKGDAKYRLLSEAEWEYLSQNKGNKIGWADICKFEKFKPKPTKKKDQSVYKVHIKEDTLDCPHTSENILAVASLNANQFGIYDILGNAQEWVEDCWHESYRLASSDASPWLDKAYGDCSLRVVRGGSYNTVYSKSIIQRRYYSDADSISPNIGFRIARDTESYRL